MNLNSSKEKLREFSPHKIIDDDGFILKESRSAFKKRQNRNFRIQQSECLVGPPMKIINVWVSHILKGDLYELENYLKKNNVHAEEIVKTSHPEANFKSFKISIPMSEKNKVLQQSFFPLGIKCILWKDNKNDRISSRIYTGRLFKN